MNPKLEAITELKSQYGIGSLDAWNYLKTHSAYTDIRDRLIADYQKQGISYTPSVKELTNLERRFSWIFRTYLDLAAHKLANESGKRTRPQSINDLVSDPLHHPSASYEGTDWELDYRTLFSLYGKHVKEDHADIATFFELEEKEIPILSAKGRKYTLSAALDEEDLLVRDTYHPDLDQEEIDPTREEEYYKEEFMSWLTGSQDGKYNPNEIAWFERRFLHGFGHTDNLYRRAVKEQTLHHLWTERKIALSEMTALEDNNIDSAIERLKTQIGRFRERNRDGSEDEIEGITKRNAQDQYTLTAIKKNRRWLETVLDH